MYVNRLKLHGVKGPDRDIPEGDVELPEETHRRLLFLGANGCGKTTILETIRTLWQFFGEWLDRGARKPLLARQAKHYLASARCAAVEFVGFPTDGARLWIAIAGRDEWEELKRAHPEAAFAGAVCYGRSDPIVQVELPPGDWADLRTRSMLGVAPLPNIVHIAPDNRTLRAPPAERRTSLLNLTPLNWCTVFDPARSLDNLLLTVKALRPDDYEECLYLVNLALAHMGKRIVGFNGEGRLEVQGETKSGVAYRHPVELLSSGERQMLLLTAYAAALLRPGGIFLIDEPDLHIHISMTGQLMETLERVVQARKGQLIAASHSDLVWDWFPRPEEQVDLNPWKGTHS